MFIGAAPLGRSPLWRHWLLNLSSSPATRGLLGALLVQWTPWRSVVAEALWWPSRAVIVLALVVVGMRVVKKAVGGVAAREVFQEVQRGVLPTRL